MTALCRLPGTHATHRRPAAYTLQTRRRAGRTVCVMFTAGEDRGYVMVTVCALTHSPGYRLWFYPVCPRAVRLLEVVSGRCETMGAEVCPCCVKVDPGRSPSSRPVPVCVCVCVAVAVTICRAPVWRQIVAGRRRHLVSHPPPRGAGRSVRGGESWVGRLRHTRLRGRRSESARGPPCDQPAPAAAPLRPG